jgi:hypothetical protein
MTAMVDRLLPQLTDAEERTMTRFMAELETRTLERVPALPGADVVWVKAQLIRRWEAERRVEQPLDAMQSLHLGLGLAAAVVLVLWSAPLLLRSLSF